MKTSITKTKLLAAAVASLIATPSLSQAQGSALYNEDNLAPDVDSSARAADFDFYDEAADDFHEDDEDDLYETDDSELYEGEEIREPDARVGGIGDDVFVEQAYIDRANIDAELDSDAARDPWSESRFDGWTNYRYEDDDYDDDEFGNDYGVDGFGYDYGYSPYNAGFGYDYGYAPRGYGYGYTPPTYYGYGPNNRTYQNYGFGYGNVFSGGFGYNTGWYGWGW